MYLAHFALTRYPFDIPLEPSELFPSAAITEAQVRLKHLLELRGIGLVTGEAGSGKTTVCRQLASTLHPGLYRVFYVTLSTGNVMDMYKSIAWELGLPTERNRAAPTASSAALLLPIPPDPGARAPHPMPTDPRDSAPTDPS